MTYHRIVGTALGLLALGAAPGALAAPVVATDLGTLDLSDVIVGPVGPTVETTFAFTDEDGAVVGVADLVSFVACEPSCDAADAAYTYVHQVTPGVDLPNDAPFGDPDRVVLLDGVQSFSLNFEAIGFTGEAGFDFAEAADALNEGDITIELTANGQLVWTLPEGFDTSETITFFWRSAFAPSGPGGVYGVTNGTLSGTAAGPIPGAPVPVPAAGVLLMTGLGGGAFAVLRRERGRA